MGNQIGSRRRFLLRALPAQPCVSPFPPFRCNGLITQEGEMCTQARVFDGLTQSFVWRETEGSVFAAEFQPSRWCGGDHEVQGTIQALLRHLD
jgi:hypothetical protein